MNAEGVFWIQKAGLNSDGEKDQNRAQILGPVSSYEALHLLLTNK